MKCPYCGCVIKQPSSAPRGLRTGGVRPSRFGPYSKMSGFFSQESPNQPPSAPTLREKFPSTLLVPTSRSFSEPAGFQSSSEGKKEEEGELCTPSCSFQATTASKTIRFCIFTFV